MRIHIRPACIEDVPAIADLIAVHAARNIMLPRTPASILASLPDWILAVDADANTEVDADADTGLRSFLLGCASLTRLSPQLAELRSLAVCDQAQGEGIGSRLVTRMVEMAEDRGYAELCALTLRERFFRRQGFEPVERWRIGPKIWRDCIHCAKRRGCQEVALLRPLKAARAIPLMAEPGATGWVLRSGR